LVTNQTNGEDLFLTTRGLVKTFGALISVDKIDFALPRYEIRAVIGPNGAGKTTFFNLLTGHLKPSDGQILFRGEDITGLSPDRISHKGMAMSFQIVNIFPNFSAFENIRIAAQSRSKVSNPFKHISSLDAVNDRANSVLQLVGMEEKADVKAPNLSHGEQRHLEIGIALATNPILLLLDEPTAGMSPAETAQTARLISRISKKEGLTIIIVEHDMNVVMEVADTITVLNEGRIVAEGTPAEIRNDDEVKRAYLKGV